MQQRQLVWLVGALVVLLGLAFLAGSFDSEISTIDVPRVDIPVDDVESIEIVLDDTTSFTMARSETGWRLTAPVQARADSITMRRFTENLGDLALETVVSTNEERYDTYGVAESAKKLTVSWGNSTKTFFVGNNGPDFQSLYVRMENDPRVYLTRGRLNMPATLDTWRDKTLLDIPAIGVNRVVVTGPDLSYEATSDGSSWSIQSSEDDDPVAGDSTGVARWLGRFSPLKAIGFLDELPAAEVKAQASHQLHFTVPGGSTQTIWLLETEDDLAATVNGSNVTYRLSKSMLESFVPSVAGLSSGS